MIDERISDQFNKPVELTIALAGNPNVGKSVVFNQLTGVGVICANYPGVTVEICLGTTKYKGRTIGVVDLPGAYSLSSSAEDQRVTRRFLFEEQPGALIYVLDATNLERNLYMLIQLIDFKIPLVVMLNLVDEATRLGMTIDADRLSSLLGIPVIPTVATQGRGISEAVAAAVEVAEGKRKIKPIRISYGRDVEETINELTRVILKEMDEAPYQLPVRALSLVLMEGDKDIRGEIAKREGGAAVLKAVARLSDEIERQHGEPAGTRISRERFGLAGVIAESVKKRAEKREPLSQRLWGLTIRPLTGIPIMVAVLASLLAFLFVVGNFLSETLSRLWGISASPVIKYVIFGLFGHGELAKTLLWGFDAGIEAALTIGIPYVLVFYFILAFLEDSGYLNSIAFLTDTMLHKLGLHGRAVIPMIAGMGCNVPALIGTRVLSSAREKFIASLIIVLVPCSARITVVIGGVGRYAGVWYALGIFAVSAALIAVLGLGINKILPGEPSGLVMEMFGLRRPSLKAMGQKTWWRFREFFFVALPIVIGGSLVLGGLYETGWIWPLSAPLKPLIEDWLGLPMIAGVALIFAVLRKELALQFLVTFAVAKYGGASANLLSFMTKTQLFVYGLVTVIYIPCLAAIAVLGRELGWRRASVIVFLTVSFALLLGGLAARIL
ncbi:MAG: ferrous iron transport protein B [Actinomycetota bacterium]